MSTDFENIVISEALMKHLGEVHKIMRKEICQCFENVCGRFLVDKTEDVSSKPQTIWFISETNKCRELKVCFVQIGATIHIHGAFEPNESDRLTYSGDQLNQA